MTTAAYTQSLKQRQRREREELILRAAAELLAARGYHDMAIDDIAERVGIAKGTVYQHFASKEDLVLALFERGMRIYLETLDGILDGAGSPRAKLSALIEQVYGYLADEHVHLLGAIFQSPELLVRLMDKRHALSEAWEAPQARIAQLLDAGKAAGEFDPRMPTAVMLSLLNSVLAPGTYRRLGVREHLPADEVIHQVRRFFFRGIGADRVQT